MPMARRCPARRTGRHRNAACTPRSMPRGPRSTPWSTPIPRAPPHATFGTEALARHCVAALADRRAVLLANHGVVTVGATLQAAATLAFEVENLAGQYLDLLASGLKPVLLKKRELAEAAAQFAGYGRAT